MLDVPALGPSLSDGLWAGLRSAVLGLQCQQRSFPGFLPFCRLPHRRTGHSRSLGCPAGSLRLPGGLTETAQG